MSACNMISCVGCIQNTESILLLSDHSMASDMLLYKLAWKRVGKHTSSQILSSYINVFILTSRIGECCICRPLGCHARTGQAQGMSIVLKVMGLNPTLNDFFFLLMVQIQFQPDSILMCQCTVHHHYCTCISSSFQNETSGRTGSKAIRFLHKCFTSGHPRVIGEPMRKVGLPTNSQHV